MQAINSRDTTQRRYKNDWLWSNGQTFYEAHRSPLSRTVISLFTSALSVVSLCYFLVLLFTAAVKAVSVRLFPNVSLCCYLHLLSQTEITTTTMMMMIPSSLFWSCRAEGSNVRSLVRRCPPVRPRPHEVSLKDCRPPGTDWACGRLLGRWDCVRCRCRILAVSERRRRLVDRG